MATFAVNTGNPGVLVKVTYQDAAGGYGGWFLLNAFFDILTDNDSNPANGLSSQAALTASGAQRPAFLALVNSRLNAMLGPGHSAQWDATIVESVTPAVIDDNW